MSKTTREWLVLFAQEVTVRASETKEDGPAAEFRCHDLVDEALASMPRVAADLPTGDDVAAAEAWLKERRSDKGQRTGKPPGLSELLAAYATDQIYRRSLDEDDRVASAIALHAENLEQALKVLLDRLDEMEGPINSILSVAQVRTGAPYHGPTWEQPYKAGRAALAGGDNAERSWPVEATDAARTLFYRGQYRFEQGKPPKTEADFAKNGSYVERALAEFWRAMSETTREDEE